MLDIRAYNFIPDAQMLTVAHTFFGSHAQIQQPTEVQRNPFAPSPESLLQMFAMQPQTDEL